MCEKSTRLIYFPLVSSTTPRSEIRSVTLVNQNSCTFVMGYMSQTSHYMKTEGRLYINCKQCRLRAKNTHEVTICDSLWR